MKSFKMGVFGALLLPAVALAGVNDPSIVVETGVTAAPGDTDVIVGIAFTNDTDAGEEAVAGQFDIIPDPSAGVTATGQVFDLIAASWVDCPNVGTIVGASYQVSCSTVGSGTSFLLENTSNAPLADFALADIIRLSVDLGAVQGAIALNIVDDNWTLATSADMADGTFGGGNQNGEITIEGPALSFDLADGATLDTGSAPVGGTTSGGVITATEAGTVTDDVRLQSCGISAEVNGTFNLTYSGAPFPDTFTGGSGASETLTVTCDPASGGAATATLTCEVQDPVDDSVISSPSWPLTCQGQVPDVQVSDGVDTVVELSANVGGSDTGNMFVFNTGAANATAASLDLTSADATEISVSTGLADATITAGTTLGSPDDTLVFSCSSMVAASVSETFEISYDDLGSGNSPTATITVTCDVVDTDPIYNSDPAAGVGLPTLSVAFGNASAPEGIDVNNANTNPAGDPLTISSATASDPVFVVTVINSSFDANVAADGTDDIEVTCTPPGVGVINGTLTVQTNDPNQPMGGFTYDLSCQGTGEESTLVPDVGETLNLGTVAPNSPTAIRSIDLTNNRIPGGGDFGFSCSIESGDTAEITQLTAGPLTVAPGETGSFEYQCTPSGVESYSVGVSCAISSGTAGRGTQPTHTVTCAGRPLVIPTMSRWGLMVMSLVMLMVAGFAGRRMLA